MLNPHEELYKNKVEVIDIHCPSCAKRVPASNINVNDTIGKCDDCDRIFQYGMNDIFLESRRGRPEFIMPAGTEVLRLSESLDIDISWFKSTNKKSLGSFFLFAFMWNMIVLPIAVSLVVANVSLIALLPLSLHIMAGIGMIYYISRKLLNNTNIHITKNQIEITDGPLNIPFRKNKKTLKSKDISQLFVKRYQTNVIVNGKRVIGYGLFANLTSGEEIHLIKDMNKETYLYLEQEMERFLDIDDIEVRGEILE